MKKSDIINGWLAGALALAVTGCMKPGVLKDTANEYEGRGFHRSERNPETLVEDLLTPAQMKRAGISISKPRTLSITDAAWESHPWKMAAATAWDDVIVPGAGVAATVFGGNKLLHSGSSGDTTINNTVNGDGTINNNTGNGTAVNKPKPTTTTMTSTSTGARRQ